MDTKIKQNEGLKLHGVWRFTIRDAATGKIKRVQEYKNLIPTIGRRQIAKGLSGGFIVVAEAAINFTSLGSGTNAPANGDTQLQTEVFRKTVASNTFSANQLFVTAFYTATEAVGTHREAGLHINGTVTVNSGILFSRVAINVVKSATETLTIDYSISFT